MIVSDVASTQPFCANGWHVCNGADINSGRNDIDHHTAITREMAISFEGCFAYNANNDCDQCQDTCGPREGKGLGQGGHENARGKGCAVSGGSDPDMVGMGNGCNWRSQVGRSLTKKSFVRVLLSYLFFSVFYILVYT